MPIRVLSDQLASQIAAGEVVERHYGESLAALPLAPAEGRLVDLGSGAGFPGWVLAAARPGLEVTLVDMDQAALDLVRLASPFDPFPADVRARYDTLRFAYEWRFLEGARSAPGPGDDRS